MIIRNCLLAALLLAGLTGCLHRPPITPGMAMWRLDCGRFDIKDFEGGPYAMPVSCYLIRHGEDYLLFDAGLDSSLIGHPDVEPSQTVSLDRTLAQQLAEIGVDPAKVTTLIVSHYHGDHTGQAGSFPNARLLIGAADAQALRKESEASGLTPWLNGQRKVEEISADRDLLGDRRLVVLFTPGHTLGHLSMLVRLAGSSYILTGDLVHSRKQLTMHEPSGNSADPIRGKAEVERVLALAGQTGAQIIVGHSREDIALLPTFPAAAK